MSKPGPERPSPGGRAPPVVDRPLMIPIVLHHLTEPRLREA